MGKKTQETSKKERFKRSFFEKDSLRSAPRLSAVGGQFDARSAQSVFSAAHVAGKNEFDFFHGVRAVNSARLF